MARGQSLLLFLLVVMVGVSQGAEWFTSRGYHCINPCTQGEREGRQVYSCRAVDGVQKESILATGGSGSRPGYNSGPGAQDPVPWDYCTPAPVASLAQDETDSSVAASIPGRLNNTGAGSGGSTGGQGGSNFNPGSSSEEMPSSLPGINCAGGCFRNTASEPFKCIINGQPDLSSFYCSPRYQLERQQISATLKLWCISPCIREANQEHYMCKTMLGMDRCSPQRGLSSRMNNCRSPCNLRLEENNHFHCQVDENRWETCGNWEVDREKTAALEYTGDGQVCASPCQNLDGDMVCSYVDWKVTESETAKKATLNLYTGFCGASGTVDWTLIGIIIGAVVGAIILVAIVAALVSRRKYTRASTEAH